MSRQMGSDSSTVLLMHRLLVQNEVLSILAESRAAIVSGQILPHRPASGKSSGGEC
jgi:hypothetical protein